MAHDFHEHEAEHPPLPLRAPTHVRNTAALPRGAGRGQLLFLDAFSGIAGDMLLAGLVDLGVPSDAITSALQSLAVSGYELRFVSRTHAAITACGLDVHVRSPQSARDYPAIRELIERADGLAAGARTLALAAFAHLAAAEAEVHGTTPEHVHFHEVGAIDSIADIVGAAVALDYLGADVVCSPLPMGRGFTRSQHGVIPLPAPATLACLRGVPTYDAGIDVELVTPTGACLVRAAAKRFARWPNIKPSRIGFGAGTRELADRPNVLRLVLGEPYAELGVGVDSATHVLLELNVDDMSGELMAVALARAQEAGALDTWSTPIGGKKSRPAVMLSALVRRAECDRVARALLSETTSLGLRVRDVGRIERARRILEVHTPYGAIAVKVADGDGFPPNVAPEYESCRAAAEAHAVPVKQVYAAAIAAYLEQGAGR
jgi:uncharacterized protein (TIGR00299 family) protein